MPNISLLETNFFTLFSYQIDRIIREINGSITPTLRRCTVVTHIRLHSNELKKLVLADTISVKLYEKFTHKGSFLISK